MAFYAAIDQSVAEIEDNPFLFPVKHGQVRECLLPLVFPIEAALACPAEHIAIGADDSREIRELKQIVNGMKDELAAYLKNGNGTVKSYYRRLVERTVQEVQIYERTKRELEGVKDAAVWEQKNEALRKLGLRTIPNPHETE